MNGFPVRQTLVNSGSATELVLEALVKRVGLRIYTLTNPLIIRLASYKRYTLKNYIKVPINVIGVVTVIYTYIIYRNTGTYNLLLGRN